MQLLVDYEWPWKWWVEKGVFISVLFVTFISIGCDRETQSNGIELVLRTVLV